MSTADTGADRAPAQSATDNITELLASAPPLTPEQRTRLAAVLRSSRVDGKR